LEETPAIIIIPSFADFPWYFSCSATYTILAITISYYTRLIAVRFPESVGEPLQTLVETITSGGAGGLDELEIVSGEQNRESGDN